MKRIFTGLICVLATVINCFAYTPEMKTITLSDGEKITARICLPDNEVKTIVFAIHGTGPNNYLIKRDGFDFYDVLADGFCEKGVAFFSYNRRGCDIGDTSPLYNKIDTLKYRKYTPLQEAEDIEMMIKELRKDKRFKKAKIILYGISEGTIIAPLVADRKNVEVDALFLHGYANENMYDIIEWQNNCNGIMIMTNAIFDKNDDGKISKEEYEFDDKTLALYKTSLFGDLPFDSIDINNDKVIDVLDLQLMRAPYNAMFMEKITEGDDEWIMKNYFPITSEWLKEHFALEANKTRLLRVDIPIFIFHGTDDASVPVEEVHNIQERFKICNKTNLTINIFDKHDHSLNFHNWLVNKKHSEGNQKIFDTAAEL